MAVWSGVTSSSVRDVLIAHGVRAARAAWARVRWVLDLRWRLRNNVIEGTQALAMIAVLKPAADYFSASTARAIAGFIGVLRDVSPFGTRDLRAQLKWTFQLSDECAKQTARKALATRYCDFVALRRIVRGRDDPGKWRVVEVNGEGVRALRESGASYIVAAGHFSREAQTALFMPVVTPGRMLVVVGGRPPQGFGPRALRARTELGQMLHSYRQVHKGNLEFFFVGQGLGLLEHLRRPGGVVLVNVDPEWQQKRWRHDRPFAGHRSYPVSTGTAALARLARCPIATCIPFVADDGCVVLEWGNIIWPPAPADEEADIRVTNELLDRIERAVGLRPAQYVLPIGGDRQWNPTTCRWGNDNEGTPFLVAKDSEPTMVGVGRPEQASA